jgi:hypothetical protein
MAIEQALISKLEPHAKRIRDGDGNDFDYLPAVLLQLLEEQKRQAKLLDDTAKLLASVKIAVSALGEKSEVQIAEFERGAQVKMEQIATATKNTQTQLENSKSSISEQISVLTSAHAEHTTQISDGQSAIGQQISVLASANAGHTTQTINGQSAIGLQIESLGATTQQSHLKLMRLLTVGLVASTIMIGLALIILQRH